MKRKNWTVTECKKCAGSGWEFDFSVAHFCDSDRLCRSCAGTGFVPEKVSGFTLIAIEMSRIGELYESRREAIAALHD